MIVLECLELCSTRSDVRLSTVFIFYFVYLYLIEATVNLIFNISEEVFINLKLMKKLLN